MTEPAAPSVHSPAAWRSDALDRDPGWRRALDESMRAELLAAVAHAAGTGKPVTAMTRGDFPLPTCGRLLESLPAVLEGGRGFQILTGLPVESLDEERNMILLWGLGRYLGEAEPQDKAGALVHVVTDTGQSVDATDHVRGFQTSGELTFHTDGADVFALLCVRQAQSGGDSRLVSSTAVFDEVVRRRPDLARVLQEPFDFDARAQNPWERKVQSVPIFTRHDGLVSALYKRHYIELAQRFPEVARLTREQVEALDLLDEVAADPALALYFRIEPGDLVLANNYSCFHARTAYRDHPDPARSRRMHRLWLTLDNGRPLPEVYADTREWGLTYRRRNATARRHATVDS